MKRLLLFLCLIILYNLGVSQITPKFSCSVPTASTNFLTNIPQGSVVVNTATNKTYLCITAAGTGENLTTASSKFQELSTTTGTVTNIATTTPLTGGPITSTGTVSIVTDTLSSWRSKMNQGASANTLWGYTNRMGFVDNTQSTLSFNNTDSTLTLTKVSGNIYYIRQGVICQIASTQTKKITYVSGRKAVFYFYIDNTAGTLEVGTTAWTLKDDDTKVPVAVVNWDGYNSYRRSLLHDERHTCRIDRKSHYIWHALYGTKYQSGLTISGQTVLPATATSANNQFKIASGEIDDEDLDVSIAVKGKPTTSTHPWTIYKRNTSTTWVWDSLAVPYPYSATYIQWDNGGTLTTGVANKFYNSYVIFTNIKDSARVVIIPGRGEYSSAALAEAEDPRTWDWTGYNLIESLVMYRLTWQTFSNATGALGRVKLNNDPQVITQTISNTTIASAANQWTTIGNDILNTNSGNVGINAETPQHKLSIRTSKSTSEYGFNIVQSDWNKLRNTHPQSVDTSSFHVDFTDGGKPLVSMVDNIGANVFSIDSTKLAKFAGSVLIGTTSGTSRLWVQDTCTTVLTPQFQICNKIGGSDYYRMLFGYNSTGDYSFIQSLYSHPSISYKSLLLNPNGGEVTTGSLGNLANLNVNGNLSFGDNSNGYGHLSSGSWGTEIGLVDNNDSVIAVKYKNSGFQYGGVLGGLGGIYINNKYGYAGIGTTNPQAKLHIYNLATLVTRFQNDRDTTDILLTDEGFSSGYEAPRGSLGFNTSDGGVWIRYGVDKGGVEWGKIVREDNQGDVFLTAHLGIGTTMPNAVLHIGQPAVYTPLFLASNNIGTGFDSAVIITSKGYVGIGTTAPSYKLHVKSLASSTPLFMATNNKGTGFDSTVTINKIGNVGIGTTDPTIKLTVATTGDVYGLNIGAAPFGLRLGYFTSAGYAVIQPQLGDGYNHILAISPSGGNVGIGTTSPSYKLSVTGTMGVTGAVTLVDKTSSTSDSLLVRDGNLLKYKKATIPAAESTFGTVTSITMGYGLSSTQSPLTSSGTMKADSTVLWSTVRASHLSSYPTLNQNTTGTAAGLSASGTNGYSYRYISNAWRAWPDSTGGGHTIDSIWHTPASATYASTSTFTFTGTAKTALMIVRSLFRCVNSAVSVLRAGYIKSATESGGTITCTVITTSDLAAGDKNFAIAFNRKVDDYLHQISIPGECIADASYSQGTWLLDTPDSTYLLPVNIAVRTAAAGSGAALTYNVYSGATNLFSSAPDLTTNTVLREQRPTTFLINPASNISFRILTSAGATNKASDLQAKLYVVPSRLFYAY